jgi:hypothetical protein
MAVVRNYRGLVVLNTGAIRFSLAAGVPYGRGWVGTSPAAIAGTIVRSDPHWIRMIRKTARAGTIPPAMGGTPMQR